MPDVKTKEVQIKMLRGVRRVPGFAAKKGETKTVSQSLADDLIARGLAQPVTETKAASK